MQQINWGDMLDAAASSGVGVALPAGTYRMKIVSSEVTVFSTGKEGFKVKFEVTEGPHAGHKVFNNFVLSPESAAAMGFFFKHMAALGLPREYFAQNPQPEAVADALMDREAMVKVKPRKYQGQDTDDVKDVLPLTGAPAAPPQQAAPATPAPPVPPAPAAAAPPTPPASPFTVQQ